MTLTVATVIAGAMAAMTPLLLRYVKLDGLQMAAASYGAALLIAAGAALITGELHFDRASLLTVLGGSAAFWSVQQAAFKVLREQNPTVVATQPMPWAKPSP